MSTKFVPLYKRGARSVDVYKTVESIGEGTFGQVFLAEDTETKERVALKKVKMTNEKEGFPITAIREIKILKMLHHVNVLKLREIVTSKPTEYNRGRGSVYMVFDYIEHDLAGLIEKFQLDAPTIKCYMKQLLEGLNYCHVNNILHRDIKSANLLIGNDGILRLADFGLARSFRENQQLTTNVVTMWYRAPELLLDFQKYTPAIDVWAAGCTLVEAFIRRPLFMGKTESEMIHKIFSICGSPSASSWPDVANDKTFAEKIKWKPQPCRLVEYIRRYNSQIDDKTLDLVSKMLALDPKKRISVKDALDHDFFWTKPLPLETHEVRKYDGEFHEWQVKKARRKQQQRAHGHHPPHPPHQSQGHSQPGHQQQTTGQSGHSQTGGHHQPSHQQQHPAPLAHHSRAPPAPGDERPLKRQAVETTTPSHGTAAAPAQRQRHHGHEHGQGHQSHSGAAVGAYSGGGQRANRPTGGVPAGNPRATHPQHVSQHQHSTRR